MICHPGILVPFRPSKSTTDTAVVRAHAYGQWLSNAPDVPREFGYVSANQRYQPTPEERAQLQAVRPSLNKRWRGIERDLAAGNESRARRKAGLLMGSKSLAYWAAYHVLRKSRPAQRGTLSVAALVALARDLNTSGGKVIARARSKSDGGHRLTYAYSLVDRTRQVILAKSLGMTVRFHRRQTGVAGRGVHHAVREVRELIKTGKYTSAIELDIQDFFGSVDARWIAEEFRLPPRVQREVLTNQGKEERGEIIPRDLMSITYINRNRTKIQSLPQGASSSSIFAISLLRTVMEDFEREHPEVAIVSNCDNFLLMAPNRKTLEAARTSLISMCAEHPAGRLLVRPKSQLRRISDGIDYLGYRFVKRKGQPVVQAVPARVKRYRWIFGALVREIENPSGYGTSRDERIALAAIFARENLPNLKLATDDFFDLLSHSVNQLRHHVTNREVKLLIKFDERNLPHEEDSIENSLGAGTRRWRRNVMKWGGMHDVDHLTLHYAQRCQQRVASMTPGLGLIVPRSPTAHIPR